MTRFIRSKTFAWCAFLLVIVVLIATFSLRTAWWAFIDIFFIFMAAFVNLMAVTLKKINPAVGRMLNKWTLVFCVLWLLAFIGEWIAMSCC
ncbi:MAG: hypothetical protein K2G75_05200 [Muribaculaceae bacterium]|nr:hypothetical protein [Muribaculaceae bacterium]MDE5924703.1 hypothetical protein [Muribaculaceae bacterium]